MKKITLLLLLSVACSASINAQKLFSKEWKEQQMGKDSASLVQKQYKERQKVAKFQLSGDPMVDSGRLLKMSTRFQFTSYALGIVGTGVAIAGSYQDKVSDRNMCLFCGGGIAAIGLIFQVKSIEYKYKAGKYLEIGAGRIAYNF